MAWKHMSLRVSRNLVLFITDIVAFARQVDTLEISCGELLAHSRSQLRNAMLAAGKALHIIDGHNKFTSPVCGGQIFEVVRPGGVSLVAGPSAWADKVRCCCRACEACLHRDGKASFPEEAAQDLTAFGA